MLHVYEVTYFADCSHSLSAASAANDQYIIFQRNNRFSLLSIKRISQNRIEILCASQKLISYKMLVVGFLVCLGICHGRMKA